MKRCAVINPLLSVNRQAVTLILTECIFSILSKRSYILFKYN